LKNIKNLSFIAVLIVIGIAAILLIPRGVTSSSNNYQDKTILSENYCEEHSMQEDACFYCNPNLREKGRLWCAEHNRYEDRCFICHPGIQEKGRLWCSEHLLYEDECYICHPEILNSQDTESQEGQRSDASVNLQCVEHGVLEAECGICHPELITDLEFGEGLKIRFESTNSAYKAGVLTDKPKPILNPSETTLIGRVSYNHNKLARITPLTFGVIQEVYVELGASVLKDQRMLTILSPEIAQAKGVLLSALSDEEAKEKQLYRDRELSSKNITPLQEFEQSQAIYQIAVNTTATAKQTLLNFGLSMSELDAMINTKSISSTLTIRSPLSGTIIERNAVIGESVRIGDRLFTVVDLNSMWLDLSVPEYQANQVDTWSSIVASFDVLPGILFNGDIEWISQSIDEHTRTLKVRAVIENSDLKLKNGMFGDVRIQKREIVSGVSIPSKALQWIDGDQFLFNKLADDLYEIRKVAINSVSDDQAIITSGISASDEIVVTGSYVLKSEFLKSRLGAGCVDD
jgi:cobalt-zinc-cadmium efflux system membrane fusion protein